ncbi:hypothetical protein FIV42_06225 [Persicimonas caeni]|uniref:Uncharacterized protein n=1 Tax=Persicimonas caeni TaxID=2292766 RepID=A0A4Y6PPS8_PERCE|nr:hypothetical protein [Persicimonas caeni]QDG50342.1 hypothetical protein FIV42_06225 [Persicimonas caeni]QED31563.1 hypothetical protein FRD00_06220 [Persicimonas caeni]
MATRVPHRGLRRTGFRQVGRWALLAFFVLVVAPVGFGCQCHTASVKRAEQKPVECPKPTEANVEEVRQAARQRANQFLEVVEYAPATLGPSKALAVLSYPRAEGSLGSRSFVYDDALALLWFAWSGQQAKASGIAETLIYLQNPDGSWGFSFGTKYPADYHASYVRNGTVAWAAHALGYFGERYGQPRAIRAARRGADFLRRMRLGGNTLDRGLVSAGYNSASTPYDAPPGPTLQYAVTEHQFDAHFVLARWEPSTAERLAERMNEVLWLDEEGRFAVAVASDRLNDNRALDAAGAWGALWLLSTGERERAVQSYRYALDHFETDAGELYGFRPYEDSVDGYDPVQAPEHIFVEGTMSMGLAAHRLGDRDTAQKVVATGVALSCRGENGLPYSNVEVPGFSTRPAAASTIWFLFLDREMATGQNAPVFESIVLDTTG